MKISDSARDVLLNIMKSKLMNPKEWGFELRLMDSSAIGIGFVREITAGSETFRSGDLTIVSSPNLDTTGIYIDFAEVNGRKGIVFGGNQESVPTG